MNAFDQAVELAKYVLVKRREWRDCRELSMYASARYAKHAAAHAEEEVRRIADELMRPPRHAATLTPAAWPFPTGTFAQGD